MAHRTLIGGTAYNISGGKSMVSGTVYNISGGRTMVGGTGYNISFGEGGSSDGEPTAMLYSDGDFVFQRGDKVESGKSLVASYTGFEDASYSTTNIPWRAQNANIKNIRCKDEISPINMAYWFSNSVNLINFDYTNFNTNNVTNISRAFYQCINYIGSPRTTGIGNITDMSYAYYNCSNLTGRAAIGSKVTNASRCYYNCSNLNSSITAAATTVTDISYAFYNCWRINGSAPSFTTAINMSNAFYNCTNLTGEPKCGYKVNHFAYAYFNCKNITGSPNCGNNVVYMNQAYYNCQNLTGPAVCGNNVKYMAYAYCNCKNIGGNAYFYSKNVSTLVNCFRGKNNYRRLNIYVPSGSTTNTTVHYTNNSSIVGANITWTSASGYRYNTTYNIYIYPVSNVAANRAANGD